MVAADVRAVEDDVVIAEAPNPGRRRFQRVAAPRGFVQIRDGLQAGTGIRRRYAWVIA